MNNDAKTDADMDALAAERAEVWKRYAHERLCDMEAGVAEDVGVSMYVGEMDTRVLLSRGEQPAAFLDAATLEKMEPAERVKAEAHECGVLLAMREFRAQNTQ